MQQKIITDKGERAELVSDFYDKLGRRLGQFLILDGQGGGRGWTPQVFDDSTCEQPLILAPLFLFFTL